MSHSERITALVQTMHARMGVRSGTADNWLDWTTFEPELHAAMAAVFKRLPTKQKLGQFFSHHNRQMFGSLVLYGAYSSKRSTWIWRAIPKELLEQPPERQDALTEPLEEPVPPEPPPISYPGMPPPRPPYEPPPPAERSLAVQMHMPPAYQREPSRTTADGRVIPGKIVIDLRTGEPLLERPAAPPRPEKSAQRLAWEQRQRERGAPHVQYDGSPAGLTAMLPSGGPWADPGGVVGHAIEREYVSTLRRS